MYRAFYQIANFRAQPRSLTAFLWRHFQISNRNKHIVSIIQETHRFFFNSLNKVSFFLHIYVSTSVLWTARWKISRRRWLSCEGGAVTKNWNQEKFFAFSFQHLVKLKLQVVGPYGLCNCCQSLCHTRTFVSSRLSRVTRINTISSQQGSAVWAKEKVKLEVVGPAHGLHAMGRRGYSLSHVK